MFHTKEIALAYKPELGRKFALLSPVYVVHDNHNFVVPIGFTTDLASIPRVFRGIFPGHGTYTPAAVVHDYLYHSKGTITLYDGTEWSYTRKQADEMFLEAMKCCGVGRLSRYTIYAAVRVGGWASW